MPYDPYKPTFGVGTRVKVVRQRKYPNEKLLGLIGTVRTDSGSNISVVFDTIKNARSSYGCFYFKPVELVEVDEFDNEIMEVKKMEKITGYLNIAKVRYVNMGDKSGLYQYANFEGNLRAGDLCVICSEEGRLLVARVEEIVDSNTPEMYREVVGKIDRQAYDARLKFRARAAELKSKMEARAKQLQDIALYQMLAKDDPDMADLLKEYQSIPMV